MIWLDPSTGVAPAASVRTRTSRHPASTIRPRTTAARAVQRFTAGGFARDVPMSLPSRRDAGYATRRMQRVFRLALAADGLALLTLVLGSWTRINGAGLTCPDWPLCRGRLIPA